MLVNRKVASLRKEKGMSMNELASASGVAQTTISRFESGQIKRLELEKLSRIAAVLSISMDDLIEGDPLYADNIIRAPYAKRGKEITVEDDYDKELLFSFHRMSPEFKANLLQLAHLIASNTN